MGLRPRARRRAACRSTRSRCARTSTRSRSSGSPPTSRAAGRRSCTRTSSTPTPTGSSPGRSRGVPVRFSTKHGFNEFRESPGFALGDRTVAGLAHVHIAISRGLARYLAETRGLRRGELRDRPLRDRRRTASRSRTPDDGPRLLCVGRLIPIKGHIVLLRAFAAAKREVPELELDIAGRGPLEPALRRWRESSESRTPCASSATWRRSRRAIEQRRDRGRALDGRGLRHGRARGDGACPPGDRRRDRRPRRARAGRRDRAARRRPARPSRSRARSSRWRATSPRAAEMGAGRTRARALEHSSRALRRPDGDPLRGGARRHGLDRSRGTVPRTCRSVRYALRARPRDCPLAVS